MTYPAPKHPRAALRDRFETHKPSPKAAEEMERNRGVFAGIALDIDAIQGDIDPRCAALAITKLEEALFWLNKAIILADNAKDASA